VHSGTSCEGRGTRRRAATDSVAGGRWSRLWREPVPVDWWRHRVSATDVGDRARPGPRWLPDAVTYSTCQTIHIPTDIHIHTDRESGRHTHTHRQTDRCCNSCLLLISDMFAREPGHCSANEASVLLLQLSGTVFLFICARHPSVEDYSELSWKLMSSTKPTVHQPLRTFCFKSELTYLLTYLLCLVSCNCVIFLCLLPALWMLQWFT